MNLLRATWAAITLCLSTTSRQLVHWHSFQRQSFLWPFRHETTPWLRQRAHFGVRNKRLQFLDDVNERIKRPDGQDMASALVMQSSIFPFYIFVATTTLVNMKPTTNNFTGDCCTIYCTWLDTLNRFTNDISHADREKKNHFSLAFAQ